MRKTFPIKFRVAHLLASTAVVALLFGYAAWRRQHVMSESRELAAQGFSLQRGNAWMERVWPSVPQEAAFEYYSLTGGRVKAGNQIMSETEAGAFYEQACDRLKALGVEEVRLDLNGAKGDSYTSTSHGGN